MAKRDTKAKASEPASPELVADWRAAWPDAMAVWSPYIQLRSPRFLADDAEAAELGMAGQIAAIDLRDQTIMVNLQTLANRGLEGFALPILAHEIGHHVFVPGNLLDNGRMIAAMMSSLGEFGHDALAMAANLWGDLLINDRLHRRGVADLAAVYRQLQTVADPDVATETWKLFLRTYEHLWRLPVGDLVGAEVPDELNADAALVARMVRHYAGNFVAGARRFAAVLYPYFQADGKDAKRWVFVRKGLGDCRNAGASAVPDGLAAIGEFEEGDDDFDKELEGAAKLGKKGFKADKPPEKPSGGQFREPFKYGELLRALGLNLDDKRWVARYYRERAAPHLIPFPSRKAPDRAEPLHEGYEAWELGDELDDFDALASVGRNPVLVPGVTMLKAVYGATPSGDPAKTPMDLDIYVDCSGSMPHPAQSTSYLALAATILALSALRAGAKVQGTIWSGARQFACTDGFSRDPDHVLGVITDFIAGATAFPLHVLRDTYAKRPKNAAPAHVVVISDDGVDTMLHEDEFKTPGAQVVAEALAKARGGGTLVLNLWKPLEEWPPAIPLAALGLRLHRVTNWEDLVRFARQFVRETYAG